MKCVKCGGSDSFSSMYVDRNGNYFSDTELEAFRVLHPEVNDKFYKQVVLCGFCQFDIKKEWLQK